MNDRVKRAQDDATTEFVANVGRALTGRLGDTDAVCELFTETHNRQTAQAVLQLLQQIDTMRLEVAQNERRKMRIDSGFDG